MSLEKHKFMDSPRMVRYGQTLGLTGSRCQITTQPPVLKRRNVWEGAILRSRDGFEKEGAPDNFIF
jgi:hypothetical protein